MILSEMIRSFKEEWPFRDTDPTQDTGSPSNAVIISSLNMSAMLAWKEISATMPPRNAVQETMTYPAATDFVELPEVLRHAKVLRVAARPTGTTSESRALRAVPIDSFINNSYDGFPENYCVTGGRIWLRARPSQAQELQVLYVARGPTLAAQNDELEFIPVEHHDFIVLQAVLLRKRVVGDDTGGLEATVGQMRSLFIMSMESEQHENPVVSDDNLGDYYE